MPKIQMEVIPEPANSASVLFLGKPQITKKEPYALMVGNGDTDYVCGGCRAVIASQVNRGQLINIVLKCLKCSSYNVVRGT